MKKAFQWSLWTLGILLGALVVVMIADWLSKLSEKVF